MQRQPQLFDSPSGAEFSVCGKFRFKLWRIWDERKPFVMFIGLNPSTANADTDDATISRVKAIAANLGYGGVFMMNCFPLISTDPDALKDHDKLIHYQYQLAMNFIKIQEVAIFCEEVIFAWGNFDVVTTFEIDKKLIKSFPNAKALHINKSGSPKHPLYCKSDIQPVKFKQ